MGGEGRGVSTDVLFRLELLEAVLARLEELTLVLTGHAEGRLLAHDL